MKYLIDQKLICTKGKRVDAIRYGGNFHSI